MPVVTYWLDQDYKAAVQVGDSDKYIIIHLKVGEVTNHLKTDICFM
ncbi:hypothetical protein SAMN04488009_2924 [Maribacter sedimenticola]|uniref:Uncharacterized protein n=1 Tax=Maribacter sedimenticola TaxID=228956 RepID=A0ABY1SKB2_9FLAO|nr:hypothetical protein SAMN04488009_2924 [Maribacter sedimenticola]